MQSAMLVPITFPEGTGMMTWSVQAVYMKNGQEVSKWCPPVSIILRQEGPVMASPVQIDPSSQALERSVKHLSTNGVEEMA
jgi:hypothetical protein